MAKSKKSGPILQSEIDFCKLNMKTMSPLEIAEKLGRNPDTITKLISSLDITSAKNDFLDLKKREDFKILTQQFTEDEILLARSHWNSIVAQLDGNILYTESLTLMNAIKFEILSNRILIDQQKVEKEISRLEKVKEDLMNEDPIDQNRIDSIDSQIASYCAAQVANNKEFRECSTKLRDCIKELKGNRNERITRIQDAKVSFAGLMRQIIEDPKMKRECGTYIEKMRLAMENEVKRLGSPHQYINNEIDLPLLNLDTLKLNEEKENKEDE